jgi:hypothetical protein
MGSGDGRIGIGLNLGLWRSGSNDNYPWESAILSQPISRRMVITAFDGISLLDLAERWRRSCVASTSGGARRRLATYECSVVSVRGGAVKTANGVPLVTGWRGSGQTVVAATEEKCERGDDSGGKRDRARSE